MAKLRRKQIVPGGGLSGSIVITGSLTVTEGIFSELGLTQIATIIFESSGSTILGDSQDDTHQFTGSIFTSGSIIVSNAVIAQSFTGSFSGSISVQPNKAIQFSDEGVLSGESQFTYDKVTNTVELLSGSLNLTGSSLNFVSSSLTASNGFQLQAINTTGDLFLLRDSSNDEVLKVNEEGVLVLKDFSGSAPVPVAGGIYFDSGSNQFFLGFC